MTRPAPQVETADPWWSRADLHWRANELRFAQRSVAGLARQFGTPCFLYSAARLEANVERLQAALQAAGLDGRSRINYAMKANRFAPLMTLLKYTGKVGIDACSPNEVVHAVSCGFEPEEISFTGTSLSQRDIDRLAKIDNLRVNLDGLYAIREWGRRKPESRIGIRINPACGVSRDQNDKLAYAGTITTKFGVYAEQFDEALATAARYGLIVDTIHFHTGCGYLDAQLDALDAVLHAARPFIDQVATLRHVNIGGGLGVPHVTDDRPLSLSRWSEVLAVHFGDGAAGVRSSVTVEIEPGEYIAKDAGVLLLTVGSVEKKRDTVFVGVDAGFNLAVEPTVYGLPFEPVPAIHREGDVQRYTIAGHINEAMDVWYQNIMLPALEQDDILAILNAGAYSSSMASNHCMRGDFSEFLLPDPAQ